MHDKKHAFPTTKATPTQLYHVLNCTYLHTIMICRNLCNVVHGILRHLPEQAEFLSGTVHVPASAGASPRSACQWSALDVMHAGRPRPRWQIDVPVGADTSWILEGSRCSIDITKILLICMSDSHIFSCGEPMGLEFGKLTKNWHGCMDVICVLVGTELLVYFNSLTTPQRVQYYLSKYGLSSDR